MTEIIRGIYRQSFGTDEPDFENQLFECCASKIKYYEVDGRPVSFLFALPCRIVNNGNNFAATYIFAAATAREYRKMGYMSALLEKVKLKADGILILRPANAPLIDYYKKSGFIPFTATDTKKEGLYLEPLAEFKTLIDKTKAATCNGEFTAMAYNSPINLENLYFPYSMP
ncbi:MAG: GNAT family N-acetyltransferase [Acutalibacteraceae bacterium]|jgi:predicted acetyltransferase